MDNQTPQSNPLPVTPPAQTAPPVQSTQPATPPPSKSFFSGKLIILIVILLIILAGGGTYLVLNSQTKPEISKITPTPLPIEASVKEGGPTASWKTYLNTTYGFSFKYPKAWYTQEVPGWNTPGASISFYQNGATPTENYADTPTNTLLNVQLSKSTQTSEQFRNTASQAYGYQKTLTIGGAPAFQIQAKTNTRQYYIKYSTTNLMILTAYTSEAVTALDVIVSSIKFTDASQATDTSSWRTYSGKYFTFKYPSTWTDNTGPASNYPENLEAIGLRIGIAVFEADFKNYSYEKGLEMNKDRKSQSLIVDGKEATKFEYIGQGDVLPEDYSIISVVVKGLDEKSYLIGFNGPRKDITDELINQILSTFKFKQ